MFNIGFSEMVFLAVIALVFIGPKELPQLARLLGRFLNELRRSTDSLKEEFKSHHIDTHISDIKKSIVEGQTSDQSTVQTPVQTENKEQVETTEKEKQNTDNEKNESKT